MILYGLSLLVGGLLAAGLGRVIRLPLLALACADVAMLAGLLLLLAAVVVEPQAYEGLVR